MLKRKKMAKASWPNFAAWQKDVYARVARALLESPMNRRVVETRLSPSAYTLTVRMKEEFPEAEGKPEVLLRPSAEGGMEILMGTERREAFSRPTPPEQINLLFQQVLNEAFGAVARSILTGEG